MTTIRVRLRELMTAKTVRDGRDPAHDPITQDEIATQIGIAKGTMSSWARDKVDRMDKDTLIKFCDYFECDLSDLIVLERR
jgi:DNA-binding Xre family transcriptional regulator